MGIFNTIKKLFSNPAAKEPNNEPMVNSERHLGRVKQNKYYDFVDKGTIRPISTIPLQMNSQLTWNSFFSVDKKILN